MKHHHPPSVTPLGNCHLANSSIGRLQKGSRHASKNQNNKPLTTNQSHITSSYSDLSLWLLLTSHIIWPYFVPRSTRVIFGQAHGMPRARLGSQAKREHHLQNTQVDRHASTLPREVSAVRRRYLFYGSEFSPGSGPLSERSELHSQGALPPQSAAQFAWNTVDFQKAFAKILS